MSGELCLSYHGLIALLILCCDKWDYNTHRSSLLWYASVFKDGGKEEKKKDPNSSPVKCYFVRFESEALIDQSTPYILSNKTVFEARCLFMHAHTVSSVPSYMARYVLK